MEWQPIESHPHYEVSKTGKVKKGEKIIGSWLSDQGYEVVRLSAPRKTFLVHRLVAEAFIPNPDKKPFVNHINCVRNCNFAENLEWCTQWENLNHSRLLGRMQNDYWVGKRSPNALLTDEAVLEIRMAYKEGGISWESLGKKFGISKRSIGRIVNDITYA